MRFGINLKHRPPLSLFTPLTHQNGTDCKLGFRLRMPSTSLAKQICAGSHTETLVGDQDVQIKSLKPGEGGLSQA